MQKDFARLSIIGAMVLGATLSSTAMASGLSGLQYYAAAHVAGTYDFIRNKAKVIDNQGNSQLYDVTGGTDSMGEFGVRGGVQTNLGDRWMLQVGPAFYATTSQKITGDYEQSTASDTDLDFKFHMHTQRIMGEGRFYFNAMRKLDLFVGGGIGMAQVHTTGATYTLPSVTGDTMPSPPNARGLTTNQAAYSVSGGVRFPITNHINLDLGVKQLWMGNIIISATKDQTSHDYQNIKIGKITPTTYWAELGVTF
jgi:opacity protein-like surface antigen